MSGRLFNRCQTDSLDEVIPIHDIKLTLHAQHARRVRLIPTGMDLAITTHHNGSQEVNVPRVNEHEMVVFDL